MPEPDDSTPNPNRDFARALAELPTPAAPTDGWQRLQGTLSARRRRTWLRRGVPLAAAALLALALAPQWQRPAPVATEVAATAPIPGAGASELAQAIAANQALEAALRGAARPGAIDGRAAVANAELEDLIGMLDLELSDTRDDTRASALWRERAQLLEQLAGLRTGGGGTYADNRGGGSLVPAAYTIN